MAFEASPVSLIFGGLDPVGMNSGDLWNAMDGSHAGYLYVDPVAGDVRELFAPFVTEFEPGTLYRIENENGQISLKRADG